MCAGGRWGQDKWRKEMERDRIGERERRNRRRINPLPGVTEQMFMPTLLKDIQIRRMTTFPNVCVVAVCINGTFNVFSAQLCSFPDEVLTRYP